MTESYQRVFDEQYWEWINNNSVISYIDLMRRNANMIRVRNFYPMISSYYGKQFLTDEAAYVIWDGCPRLLTRTNELWQMDADTELGWLTCLEVKALSAISFASCSSSRGQWYRHAPSDSALTLKVNFDSRRRSFRINNYFHLVKKEITKTVHNESSRFPWSTEKTYSFDTSWASEKRSLKFYESFDIEDAVLLRTSYLLLRAATLMITGNRIFSETAAVYAFLGLEGAVRLLCRAYVDEKRFQIKPTCEYVGKTFTHKPGYEWMIQDAYAQRIQAVHPDSLADIYWMPDVWAIDFLYAYAMAIDFLYHAVTGDLLPVSDV